MAPEGVLVEAVKDVGRQHGVARRGGNAAPHRMQAGRAGALVELVCRVGDVVEVMLEGGLADEVVEKRRWPARSPCCP